MIVRPYYLDILKTYRDVPLVKLLAGIRRCGKSTILDMLKDDLISSGITADHVIQLRYTSEELDEGMTAKQMYRDIKEKMTDGQRYYLLLDEVQEVAFDGFLRMEVQNKVDTNGGVITLQDLRDLAVSAKTDCYHVVDAADDAQLGRFYAENDFIPELDGVSDAVFKMLDFAGIGRMMRCSENGVFVGSLYVLRDGELTTAPPVQKALPGKPGYLFRLTLGLHPDIGDARTVTLDLPAAEAELLDAQEQLGVEGWEGVTVIDYDGIIPYAADFTDLPMELEEFNAFTKAARDIPRSEVPKLKALLKQFEVQDIATAISLTECLDDYVLTPEISSPQETAIDQLHFMTDDHSAELLISHVNLYAYGCDLIREDNAVLSPYGLLHRADYQPMLSPMQETQKMEMKMK